MIDIGKIDYTKKENQTFKNWFVFCMVNLWLPITFIGFILSVLEFVYFDTVREWISEAFDQGVGTGIFVTLFLPIPLVIFGLTAYKGCYRHWKLVTTRDQKYNE